MAKWIWRRAGLLLTLACIVAPSLVWADAPECAATQAALHDLFQDRHSRMTFEFIPNELGMRAQLAEFGEQPYQAWPGLSDPENRGGWVSWDQDPPVGVSPPHRETLAAFADATIKDPSHACPGLWPSLRQAGWSKPAPGRQRPGKNGLFPYTYVGMTIPVVTASRAEAIALIRSASGPLAGSSYLVLLRFQSDGTWRVTGRFPISVS